MTTGTPAPKKPFLNKRFFIVLALTLPVSFVASSVSLLTIKLLGLGSWAYYVIPILALIPWLAWSIPWIDGVPPIWELIRERKDAGKER